MIKILFPLYILRNVPCTFRIPPQFSSIFTFEVVNKGYWLQHWIHSTMKQFQEHWNENRTDWGISQLIALNAFMRRKTLVIADADRGNTKSRIVFRSIEIWRTAGKSNQKNRSGRIFVHASLKIDFYFTETPFIRSFSTYCGKFYYSLLQSYVHSAP